MSSAIATPDSAERPIATAVILCILPIGRCPSLILLTPLWVVALRPGLPGRIGGKGLRSCCLGLSRSSGPSVHSTFRNVAQNENADERRPCRPLDRPGRLPIGPEEGRANRRRRPKAPSV